MELNLIKINKSGYVSTLAGSITNCSQQDGILGVARFGLSIQGLYFDFTRNQLLISDTGNNRIKVLDFNSKLYFPLASNQNVFTKI